MTEEHEPYHPGIPQLTKALGNRFICLVCGQAYMFYPIGEPCDLFVRIVHIDDVLEWDEDETRALRFVTRTRRANTVATIHGSHTRTERSGDRAGGRRRGNVLDFPAGGNRARHRHKRGSGPEQPSRESSRDPEAPTSSSEPLDVRKLIESDLPDDIEIIWAEDEDSPVRAFVLPGRGGSRRKWERHTKGDASDS